jgi:hypothetical protein
LKSNAAAEKFKDRLSRDFCGWAIFDFINTICEQQTFKLMTFLVSLVEVPEMSGIQQ